MNVKQHPVPEDFVPPVFWTPATEDDLRILKSRSAGRRFDLSIVFYAARRCTAGFPQVIVCAPLSGGKPFPTLFWLTCPYLDKKCGVLESQQKIRELETVFKQDEAQLRAWHAAYAALRVRLIQPEERERLETETPALWRSISQTGVGGIDFSTGAAAPKCLHLQTATWLGMGTHPARQWLEALLGTLDCAGGSCGAYTGEE